MKHLCNKLKFEMSMLQDCKVEDQTIFQDYIKYTVIPSITQSIESYLNQLNYKNMFPVKDSVSIENGGTRTLQFEFIILTPDELEEIKSNERFKERINSINKTKEEKNANISNSE